MSKHFIVLSFLPFLTACISCGNSGPANRPEPDPSNCAAACKTLKDKKCPEGDDIFVPDQDAGETSDAGTKVSCTQFCEETQKNGHALNAQCVVGIKSCGDLINCDW